jgi:hypothetical protein
MLYHNACSRKTVNLVQVLPGAARCEAGKPEYCRSTPGLRRKTQAVRIDYEEMLSSSMSAWINPGDLAISVMLPG